MKTHPPRLRQPLLAGAVVGVLHLVLLGLLLQYAPQLQPTHSTPTYLGRVMLLPESAPESQRRLATKPKPPRRERQAPAQAPVETLPQSLAVPTETATLATPAPAAQLPTEKLTVTGIYPNAMALPTRRKSLAVLANEQLDVDGQRHNRLAEGISAAELPDCLAPSQGGSLGGLFALPVIAAAAAMGKCKLPK